uniref:Secreted protein n=1 Tax=Anopheles maculatus TaxID=74869 RepID=A0A182T6D0_9DIPT
MIERGRLLLPLLLLPSAVIGASDSVLSATELAVLSAPFVPTSAPPPTKLSSDAFAPSVLSTSGDSCVWMEVAVVVVDVATGSPDTTTTEEVPLFVSSVIVTAVDSA